MLDVVAQAGAKSKCEKLTAVETNPHSSGSSNGSVSNDAARSRAADRCGGPQSPSGTQRSPNPSSALASLEAWLALLEEGRDTFAIVLGKPEASHRSGLAVKFFFEAILPA